MAKVKVDLTGIKKGNTVILCGFTGMKLGVYTVVAATKKTITIEKKDGTEVEFDRKTGKQLDVEEGKEKYANFIMEDDGSYVPPARKKKDKPAKKKSAKKAKKEEAEEEEDIDVDLDELSCDEDEDDEEEVKPKKKAKKPAKKAKKPAKKVEEDEDDEDDEYEDVE